jgi:hypothetical protein
MESDRSPASAAVAWGSTVNEKVVFGRPESCPAVSLSCGPGDVQVQHARRRLRSHSTGLISPGLSSACDRPQCGLGVTEAAAYGCVVTWLIQCGSLVIEPLECTGPKHPDRNMVAVF